MSTDTLEDFKRDLTTHDWTYAFSDDHSVYMRGVSAEGALLGRARSGGDEFKKAFNEEYARQFHREPFCKPYTFPFPEVQP